MPRNLHYHQQECDSLLSRISSVDSEAADRFESYLENFWNDIPSLIEAAEDMREILRQEVINKR